MMLEKYKVSVNNSYEFDIGKHNILELDAIQISNFKFQILQKHTTYKAEITQTNFNHKQYTVKVNNNTYKVSIQDVLDALIKRMGFEVGSAKIVNEIKAPMPGLILEINVAIGTEVKVDDPLLILEAMKMENILTSPRDGIIKSISIAKGVAVDKNQLLIEFE